MNPFAVADTIPGAAPTATAFASAPSGVDVALEDAPAPSTSDLLERAARLGPPRPTMESILLPTDPVLGQKLLPRVAERRMRFQKIVKATLGGCVALCLAALVATALSGEASAAPARSAAAPVAAPTTRVASVESLAGEARVKATRRATGTPTAHASKASAKRR